MLFWSFTNMFMMQGGGDTAIENATMLVRNGTNLWGWS